MSDSNSIFHHLSDFVKALQCVRFCLMKFKKSQIFSWKIQKKVNFWKKLHSKVHVGTFLPPNGHVCPLCVFLKALLWKKNSVLRVRIVIRKSQRVRFWINSFRTCQIMNWQTPNVSNFVWKKSQRVFFWNSKLTTCQVLLQKFYHMEDFE